MAPGSFRFGAGNPQPRHARAGDGASQATIDVLVTRAARRSRLPDDADQGGDDAAIDGIGSEDTFYFGDADENNPLAPQEGVIGPLDTYRAAGLTVLAIDYLTRSGAIDDFYARCRARGWIPYCSLRALDRLTINAAQPPQ